MRGPVLTLTALLVIAPLAAAQSPLDRHLQNWETRMKGIESVRAELVRTETAKDGSVRKLSGEARYLKPTYAALQMTRTDNPKLFEMYVCNGQFFYEYRAQTKEIWVRKLQADELKAQSNFLSLLVGLTAVEAKQRFDITLTNEDANRVYLAIAPKAGAKQRDFEKAELMLLTKSMLPDRVRFRQVNGNEVEWRVTSMDFSPMKPTAFVPPQPPGWKTVEVPGTPAPGPGSPPR
jgi:TIGR03009 family protein